MTMPKAKTITTSAIEQPEDFEHAFVELESIVAQMESGQMHLEASLAASIKR